jgi:hypothetical protein
MSLVEVRTLTNLLPRVTVDSKVDEYDMSDFGISGSQVLFSQARCSVTNQTLPKQISFGECFESDFDFDFD